MLADEMRAIVVSRRPLTPGLLGDIKTAAENGDRVAITSIPISDRENIIKGLEDEGFEVRFISESSRHIIISIRW